MDAVICRFDGKVFTNFTEDGIVDGKEVWCIHEDNAGALILAETLPPQFTPRSKHYALKTIWFREEIVKRGIKLFKISTVEQLGDIFTKSLTKVTFEYLRKKLQGW